MALNTTQVKKVAELARLALSDDDIAHYTNELDKILHLIDQINQVNTQGITPMAHPSEMAQRLRDDVVTEIDQHEIFQAIAPSVEAGLYLVPAVIE